jgi:hypothetical protein
MKSDEGFPDQGRTRLNLEKLFNIAAGVEKDTPSARRLVKN